MKYTFIKTSFQFLIENLYFRFGNVLLIQTSNILIVTDPALVWANLYLYNYESKYITNLIITNKPLVSDFIVMLLITFVP